MIGWVVVAHQWLGMSTEAALLAFIAFAIAGFSAAVLAQMLQAPEPEALPERDFYVVTHDTYRWDLPRSRQRRQTTKPELGGTIYAYDTLAAAELKYRQLEAEQQPLDLDGYHFSYHEDHGYDEVETRLWVVYARSKTEAHDKLFYDHSRRFLGHDGRTDDLLLVTDNESRKEQYLDWWRPLYGAALEAEREKIKANMTYDAAIALFGFKELPLPPGSITCEAAEPLYAELQLRKKELEAAAATTDGKARNARNVDWKASTTISVAYALIFKRISDARACGKYRPCTIHVSQPSASDLP
jgi:hypothetical protein